MTARPEAGPGNSLQIEVLDWVHQRTLWTTAGINAANWSAAALPRPGSEDLAVFASRGNGDVWIVRADGAASKVGQGNALATD